MNPLKFSMNKTSLAFLKAFLQHYYKYFNLCLIFFSNYGGHFILSKVLTFFNIEPKRSCKVISEVVLTPKHNSVRYHVELIMSILSPTEKE